MLPTTIVEKIISSASDLAGKPLNYLAGRNTFTVHEVNDTSIIGERSEGRVTIPLDAVRDLATPLSNSELVHVDTFFHGKGNYRTALETVVAHTPHAGYLPANSKHNQGAKKLIWFDDEIHKLGETLDANPILDTTNPVLTRSSSELETILLSFLDSASKLGKLSKSGKKLDSFISSLLTKPFLILTGLSGSGKTKSAQAFAQWITPKPEEDEPNPHIALIPVGADWMGNENILGYPNGLDTEGYVSTPALKLILHAKANDRIPHFLILDEMNLSHVERYFADFLSAIESGEAIPLYQGNQRKDGDLNIPTDLKLPPNLFVIGTVNVDETTYMFSPKVLDRANVIEFRMEVDDLTNFLATPIKPNLDALAGEGEGFGSAFVEAAGEHDREVPESVKDKVDKEITKFFNVLAKESAEFGYRTAYESGRFLHFFNELREKKEGEDDKAWFGQAFDAVIVQKFLPKLHGSSSKLSELLHKLWELCQHDEHKESAINQENAKAARYPVSAAKIARMIKVLERNGFVSFAEA